MLLHLCSISRITHDRNNNTKSHNLVIVELQIKQTVLVEIMLR